jgi:glycosyltransferase involved in cell wall biosynthesis
MRVLLINQTFHPDFTATAQHAHDLGKHLVGHGHEVCVITSRSLYGQKGAALPKHEVVDGIEVYRVGFSLFGKSSILLRILDFALFYVMATLRAVTLKKCDVVVPFTTPPFIVVGALLVRLLRGSKVAYWVMDLYPDLPIACGVMKATSLPARFFEAIHRFALKRCDRVVVLGRCMRDRVLAKGVPDNRITMINVWADHREVQIVPRDENRLRQEWGLGDRFVVMYSGNFGIGHDVETIAGAVSALADRDDIRFVFVGGGKRLSELRESIEAQQLNNAQFHPYQPRSELSTSLTLADLHLISLREGVEGIMVPCKLYGILAAGRPAAFIGNPASEIARTLTERDAGFTVACGDVASLIAGIRLRADDRTLATAQGERARQSLIDHYDRQVSCEAWRNLLEQLAS